MNRRLQTLENNVAELQRMKSEYSAEIVKRDRTKEWALRYGLLESIQIVIDISCHIVVHHNLGNAETYSDCIRLLADFDIVEKDLEEHLLAMAGLRNILVHEYIAIEVDRLFDMLDRLEDFTAFSQAVSNRL